MPWSGLFLRRGAFHMRPKTAHLSTGHPTTGCPLFCSTPHHTLIHWQCEVKKRWTSTTAFWKACRPHCAHRWPSWMPTMRRTFREIRLRLGQPVQFTICGRLCPAAKFLPGTGLPAALETDTLRDCFLQLCRRSVYAYEDELKQGYFTVQGGCRIGVAGCRGPGGFFRRNVAQSAHCALADLSAAARAGGTDRCPHRRAAAGRPAGQRKDHPAALSCAKSSARGTHLSASLMSAAS